jgi:hypothetical protein
MPGAWLSLLLAALLPLDVFSVRAGIWGGDNRIRFITGVIWGIFGIALSVRIIKFGKGLIEKRIDRQGETEKWGRGEAGARDPEKPLVRVR